MSESINSLNPKNIKPVKKNKEVIPGIQTDGLNTEDLQTRTIGAEVTPSLTPDTKKTVHTLPTPQRYLETKKKKNPKPEPSSQLPDELNSNTPVPEPLYDFSSLPHPNGLAQAPDDGTIIGKTNLLQPVNKQLKPNKELRPQPVLRPQLINNKKNLQPRWTKQNQRVNVRFKIVNMNKARLKQMLNKPMDHKPLNLIETPHGFIAELKKEVVLHIDLRKHQALIHNIAPQDINNALKVTEELGLWDPNLNQEIVFQEQNQNYQQQQNTSQVKEISKELSKELLKEELEHRHSIPGFS